MYPLAMRQLVLELAKLPAIGEKSAARLAYHLVTKDEQDALRLADAIYQARRETRFCEICCGLSETAVCEFCSDRSRDTSLLCVVEKPADLIALERSGGYRGVYHVLHGLWSPLRGVTPNDITVDRLFLRVEQGLSTNGPFRELIIATSTTVEGDATALFIANRMKEYALRVTRIAQGLPKGGELEYADELTLNHAIDGRRSMDET